MSYQDRVIHKTKEWVAYEDGDQVYVIHDGWSIHMRGIGDLKRITTMPPDLFNTLQGWFRFGSRPTRTGRVYRIA